VKRGPGLFPAWWTDPEGKRLKKITRREFAELYRLHRLCTQLERAENQK
jgi:hypothetical protein